MEPQQDTLSRLEKSVARLETLAEVIEDRQKKCEDNGERIAVLETRHDETVRRSARLAQVYSLLAGLLATVLTKLYDHFNPMHH